MSIKSCIMVTHAHRHAVLIVYTFTPTHYALSAIHLLRVTSKHKDK